MDLRASSTTLDTVVFVLLVGVAVGVLAGVDARTGTETNRVAEETADVLATSTAEVTYTRTATVKSESLLGGEKEHRVTVRRTAHGTYAQLLAAAAVADPSLDGQRLVDTGEDLREETRRATRRVLPTREANVQVRVGWQPYADASLGSSFTAGDAPPADADVSVATVTAPSGTANVSAEAEQAAREGGYDGVATVVARAVVDGLFPQPETGDALYSEGPDRALVAHRYRHASDALQAETAGPLSRGNVEEANRRLTAALATRLRVDLRRVYDTPAAAARGVRVHQVRIVVRTWSP